MAISDRAMQAKQRERAMELLRQGLTTTQVRERTGLHARAVLRVKKKLEEARAQEKEAVR
jgi:uncharacterized protein YerC